MADQFVTCPRCGEKIPLSQALTQEIEAGVRRELQTEMDHKSSEFKAELEVKEQEFQERLKQERVTIESKVRQEAHESVSVEMADLKVQVEEKAKELEKARKQELDLRRRQRELEDKARDLELEVARRIDAQRKAIQVEAAQKAAEEYVLKLKEKDLQLQSMRGQIEELKRKAEQGSQQVQGEVLELELEEVLRFKFPLDAIEPVKTGARGADVIQRVCGRDGQRCGSILWESKRTKAWSQGWLAKLREDQRRGKAEVAVIVSEVLPSTVCDFGCVDGIWVTKLSLVEGLATALRTNLIQVAEARMALVGKDDKLELLYAYLSGSEFRRRVEAIVQSFVAMKQDLDTEKLAMERTWAKREKQLQMVLSSTAGMYGDLQGLIGASLPSIKVLELPAGGKHS